MKNRLANKIALAIALGTNIDHTPIQPYQKPALPPKEKTQGDLDRIAKAEEKRIRKASKRKPD